MNLIEKIAQYQQEADSCLETETKAHKRRVELNSLIRQLNTKLRAVNKLLVDEPDKVES